MTTITKNSSIIVKDNIIIFGNNNKIYGNDNTIYGNNNDISGHGNQIIGNNNTFAGTKNKNNGLHNVHSTQQNVIDHTYPAKGYIISNDKIIIPDAEPNEEIVENNVDICNICMERKISTVIVDCGHRCLCVTCCQSYKDKEKNKEVCCPICRKKITRIIKTY